MTDRTITREELIDLVNQYEALCNFVDAHPDNETAARELYYLTDAYPNIHLYDNKGNYIGPVRNENGWTP